MVSTYAKVEELTEKMKSVSTHLSKSTTQQLLLYSDSVDFVNQQEVFTDGLPEQVKIEELILNLLNTNKYLLKEVEKLKYLVNIKI